MAMPTEFRLIDLFLPARSFDVMAAGAGQGIGIRTWDSPKSCTVYYDE
jgi:hypothetical protein